MNEVFIEVLNSALVSGFLILAVILARFLIKKAPKWIACALWGLVAIKLMLPIRVESIFSLVPSSNPIPSDIEYSAAPQIDTGIRAINQAVNPVLMDSYAPRLESSSGCNFRVRKNMDCGDGHSVFLSADFLSGHAKKGGGVRKNPGQYICV